jgi:NTE family protein
VTTVSDWLDEAPFTLSLSAGFFGFYAHTGVLLALEERGHVPARLTGSSAGALVAAAYAAGRTPAELAEELARLERAHFWDPFPGPGLLRGRKFHRKLEEVFPARRLEEVERPLAISVYDLLGRRTIVHSETGCLHSAVRASCAVPGLFWPVRVEGRWSWDGGLKDPCGLAGVEDDERVLLHNLSSEGPGVIPARDAQVAFMLDDLPQVSPFKLHEGPRALEDARERTRRLLDLEVSPVIRLARA